jgi:hypothetical protein
VIEGRDRPENEELRGQSEDDGIGHHQDHPSGEAPAFEESS